MHTYRKQLEEIKKGTLDCTKLLELAESMLLSLEEADEEIEYLQDEIGYLNA
jgi:hypothetical protein